MLDADTRAIQRAGHECDSLEAVTLSGTRFASRDTAVRQLTARIREVTHRVEVSVAGLARFLLAKPVVALSRRGAEDWRSSAG